MEPQVQMERRSNRLDRNVCQSCGPDAQLGHVTRQLVKYMERRDSVREHGPPDACGEGLGAVFGLEKCVFGDFHPTPLRFSPEEHLDGCLFGSTVGFRP